MRHSLGLACLLGALALAPLASAQAVFPTGRWQAYPAYTNVNALASGFGRIWAGTQGGVFSFDPATGEIERRTAIDGLRGGAIQALAIDARRNALWIGYADGGLDRLNVDDGTVRSVLDIARNTQYPSRGVRRMRVQGDSLLAATDFGVVVYDLARNEVRNTYARLGTIPTGTPVNDLLFAPLPDGRPGLWLATDVGIVTALAADPALQSPAAWTADPNFPFRTLSLAYFDDGVVGLTMFAGGGPPAARDLYIRQPNGMWGQRVYLGDDVQTLLPNGDRLLAVRQFRITEYIPPADLASYLPTPADALRAVTVGPDGRVWAGDATLGLFPLPPRAAPGVTVTFTPEPVVPEGPFSNSYAALDIGPDGTVWTASTRVPATQTSAVSRLDPESGRWTSRLTRDEPALLGTSALFSLRVGPDGRVYVGTEGDGLIVIDPDGETVRYDETNSTLREYVGQPASFVQVTDVGFERGATWVVNTGSAVPLQYFASDGTTVGLPLPSGTSGANSSRARLAIDNLGQKWLSIYGGGLIVWDTGADPASPADDRARQYRGQGTIATGGLPGPNVVDVVYDGDNRVWIGTDRGIATVFQPGSVFASDPNVGLPQFTLTPTRADGSREAFLRDVVVNDLEVDPGGRVWVATTSGAYLVAPDPSGSGFVALREINASNSPLPSSNVRRIAVRASDGRVFLTTEAGLFSVSGDATAPVAGSDALRASPSPFRPSEASSVTVSGLATARSTVRVLTLAGEVVHEAEATGGTFTWDGRDDRTRALVGSGVYLVSAVGSDGAAVTGKVAVIR